MADKPTQEQVEDRVNQCFTLLIRGFAQEEIVNYLQAKTEWGKEHTKRSLRNYVQRARAEITALATGDINRVEEYSLAKMRLTEQYRKANQLNDTARAIQAVQALISLQKLDQPLARMDWRAVAKEAGINPDALYKELVEKGLSDVLQ